MKPRLYLETTIPSYLAAKPSRDLRLAADQLTTQEWWARRRGDFHLFVSDAVIEEVRQGDPAAATARLAVVQGLSVLDETPMATALAKRLLGEGIIPAVAGTDALHLALAAAHDVDFLLTWNCRHLNNRALERRILRACEACGLTCPVICTPMELMVF